MGYSFQSLRGQPEGSFGSVTIRRWFYQRGEPGSPGIDPLNVRLGLFADRMTLDLTEVTARLAADMTPRATLDMLDERFTVRPGVEAYRRIVVDIAIELRTEQGQAAIDQLDAWIRQGRESPGDREVLLQVGRDGIFVQTRPCWEEASCGTLAVFDRGGRRLGTVHLGEMPEPDQRSRINRR